MAPRGPWGKGQRIWGAGTQRRGWLAPARCYSTQRENDRARISALAADRRNRWPERASVAAGPRPRGSVLEGAGGARGTRRRRPGRPSALPARRSHRRRDRRAALPARADGRPDGAPPYRQQHDDGALRDSSSGVPIPSRRPVLHRRRHRRRRGGRVAARRCRDRRGHARAGTRLGRDVCPRCAVRRLPDVAVRQHRVLVALVPAGGVYPVAAVVLLHMVAGQGRHRRQGDRGSAVHRPRGDDGGVQRPPRRGRSGGRRAAPVSLAHRVPDGAVPVQLRGDQLQRREHLGDDRRHADAGVAVHLPRARRPREPQRVAARGRHARRIR